MENKEEKKFEDIQKEIEDILKKNNLKVSYAIDFPVYKILPDEVKLALSVLGKHGMKIQFVLKPTQEKKKTA